MSWLDDLKPGDKVIYRQRNLDTVLKVERLTKMRIVAGGIAFNRRNGQRTGPISKISIGFLSEIPEIIKHGVEAPNDR